MFLRSYRPTKSIWDFTLCGPAEMIIEDSKHSESGIRNIIQ